MKILLCRHGQSVYNEHRIANRPDPLIPDAPLNHIGKEQARNLRKTLETYRIRAAVTSPLTRAMETCLLAIRDEGTIHKNLPIFVTHLAAEQLRDSCDIGREVHVLAEEFLLHSFDFSHLKEHRDKLNHDCWWYIPPCSDGSSVDDSSLSHRAVLLSHETHSIIKVSPAHYMERWVTSRWEEPVEYTTQRSRQLLKWIKDHQSINGNLNQSDDSKEDAVIVFGHADIFYFLCGYFLDNCEVAVLEEETIEKLLSDLSA